ncbi:Hypothetical protein, putative [Bodo saltans]|uniref:Membrane-associated protein n=1 Tax=Bodo saltans TaxID=75058 RepID=A0A0S4JD57_BODSA|nr:Hypothetical protein, putative [Bodo saltans]|eukprot:CUG89320.1 Hypothetical protein, putative [Bodo saltans]
MNALTLTLVICSLIAMPEATIVTTLFQGSISILAIALDSEGNILYVSDSNNALYRVTASGKKNTLLAGSGNSTSGTADGVGTLARFNIPQGLTCDDTNDIVFVSDTFNSLVRVVNLATNNVTTLAGSTYGYSDGVGSLAKFQHTTGIALLRSSNIVYVGDSDGSRVRKIEVATANVTTLADFGAPWGVAFVCVSQYGRFVYMTLYKISGGSIVARVDTQTSAKTVVAGSNTSSGYADGEGSNALFSTPTGIALNSDESSLVVCDRDNVRVRNIHLVTGIVTTLAGNGSVGATDGPGPLATFGQPIGSLWHCGGTFCGVLLADSSNCALRFLTIESITCSSSNIISGNRSSSMISSSSSSSEATSVSKSPWSSSSGSNSSSVDSLSFSGSPSQRRIFERSTWSFSGTGQVSRSPSNTLSFWLCTVPGDVVTVSLLPISEAAWPEHDLVILSASSSSYIYYDADNQSSNTLPLMTSPISQTVLRSAPYVGLNISFADSAGAAVAHWYVGTATLRDNKTTLQFTNAGTIGTRAHWNAVAFHPPISGWIASSTPLMTATSIAMILTMYCDGAPVFVASLTIPALANPLSYAAQVEATVRYSLVV